MSEKISAKTRKYKKLTYQDRIFIEKSLKKNIPVVFIANELGVHKDTIYKEISRTGETLATYSAEKGQLRL